MPCKSKIKLRAEILSVLNKYNTEDEISSKTVKKDIYFFRDFKEKDFLARILIDEMISGKKRYSKFCSLFVLQTLEKEVIEDYALKILEDESIPDRKKVFFLSVLKQKEIYFAPEEVENFISNPDKTAIDGVEEFLSATLKNPEAAIDLLDFYSNISFNEKISLLESLTEEETKEEIVNAFSLLTNFNLSPDENKIILNTLLSTNSPLALDGLNNILNNDETNEISKRKIKKKIQEIKFKNPKYKDTAFIENSKPHKSYMSFIDGGGNFSLIFSRIDEHRFVDAFFLTINIQFGITSVVGFYKIHKKNFEEILLRLFADSPPVEIQPSVLVSFLDYYKQKNTTTNTTLPYEYNIWAKLTNDIKPIAQDLSEYLNSKLKHIVIIEEKMNLLFNSKIIESWFYTKNQNKKVDEIFSLINKNNIKKLETLEKDILDFIDKKIMNDKEFISLFKTRILLQSYISKMLKFKILSDYLFSLCFSEKYIRIFLNFIFQKSIYFYLEEQINTTKEKNIFKKPEKQNFTTKQILNIMNLIEEKWKSKKES